MPGETASVKTVVDKAAIAILTPAVSSIDEARGAIEAFAASIDSPEDRAQAARWIEILAAEVAELEAKWSTVTQPLYRAHAAACALKRPAVEPRRDAIRLLKLGISASLERDRKRAEAELAAATTQEAIAKVEAPSVPKGMSARTVVTFRVTDASKVPEKFWRRVLDDEKILAAVEAGEIVPGIERVEEIDMRRTGKRKAGT